MCPVSDLSPHWNLVHTAQGGKQQEPPPWPCCSHPPTPAWLWQLSLPKELSLLKGLCVLPGRPGADAGLGSSWQAGHRLQSPQPRAGPSRASDGWGGAFAGL